MEKENTLAFLEYFGDIEIPPD